MPRGLCHACKIIFMVDQISAPCCHLEEGAVQAHQRCRLVATLIKEHGAAPAPSQKVRLVQLYSQPSLLLDGAVLAAEAGPQLLWSQLAYCQRKYTGQYSKKNAVTCSYLVFIPKASSLLPCKARTCNKHHSEGSQS
ncbi:hypothetical protein Anapl_01055 [Anas platyrhynchos]|uniref:Uncharacterized protein n=1 Tax=Anas platyrhynchos TaxID=8839 RepID=R0LXY6_ANAPL|nr:hypothetical protein Anapl_01055 [Anas platyrhynchos]